MNTTMIVFGILTVLSACGVIFSPKPLTSALFLVVTLFLVAVHFALMEAHFIAVIQVLVYAGAIMVLVIFVIMLLGVEAEGTKQKMGLGFLASVTFISSCVGLVFAVIRRGVESSLATDVKPQPHFLGIGTTEEIGRLLFTKYLFPFEITSLLLLAAIMGAVMLSLEKKRPLEPGRGLKAKEQEGA